MADEQTGQTLLDHGQALLLKSAAILAAAEADGDLRAALAAVREARGCLELLARLGFRDPEPDEPTAMELPEYWRRFVEIVLDEFEPWPTPASRIVSRAEALGDARFVEMLYEALPEWKRAQLGEERAKRDAIGTTAEP